MEQLGYVVLGCALVLAALGLRRVNWSKFRLPARGQGKSAWTPRTKNSVLLSIAIHSLLAMIGALFIVTKEIEHDFINVEWVKLPRTMRTIKTPEVKPLQPRVIQPPRQVATPRANPMAKPDDAKVAARRSISLVERNVDLSVSTSETKVGNIETKAELVAKPQEIPLASRDGESGRGMLSGSGAGPGRGSGKTVGKSGLGASIKQTGTVDSASLEGSEFSHLESVPDGELGAIISGEDKDIVAHIRLIRLKHSLSDWWQDPTALPSFMAWLRENTRIRADMKYKSGSLRLTEPDIQDAPMVIMTGHDKDITVSRNLGKDGPLTDGFTPAERAALRKYIIDRGGMLFFDDCGFNGLFAQQVALEFDKTFPEYPLKDIPHNHEIYKIYYELPIPPRGGDVFWSAPGAAQGAGGVYRPISSRFAYQKGISIGTRLAVIYNRKDYLCSMETAEVDSRARLRDRRSPDVHRFMTNLLVYAMKYGGNTDRSNYE
ncbi:MAG: DUF4159 domain-containing protein [Candidatus Poribacteria bacterium]|nr:DUF4159 domain-containing protein [Candidatus Poribacteria bacterium]MDE0504383.1 DUF4159 domain-containing protein [Candidatus Poribacteria bacterium]